VSTPEIPDYLRKALDQYDACMKDPTAHLDSTGRAPFEEGACVMDAIRRALDDAHSRGMVEGSGILRSVGVTA